VTLKHCCLVFFYLMLKNVSKNDVFHSILFQYLEQEQRRKYQVNTYSAGKDKNSYFIMTEQFDRTPRTPERWDMRILDHDIRRLMRMIMEEEAGVTFAHTHPQVADSFFSSPYSSFARDMFGYGG
jgi:hypothetical protein